MLFTSAQWNHFVTNYKKEIHGGGAQTWQIKINDAGNIYFANKNGILEYNGSDWLLMPLSNKSDVRSVFVSSRDGRIYAGGEKEFGFYQPDFRGEMVYNKLSGRFGEGERYSGVYWGVYEIDNVLYFVSDWHVLKYVNEQFTVIPSEYKIDCSAVVNHTLYMGGSDGVKLLTGNSIISFSDDKLLKNKTIRCIRPFRDGFIVATAFDGLFVSSGRKIDRFVTGYEHFMRQNEIFSIDVSKRFLAIGTIHKGLLVLDLKNNYSEYFNEENGLQNNTVLSLAFDKDENIWVGLDNGIDFIAMNSPLTNLYSFPNSKGAGYVALRAGNRLLLGTNRGLFFTSWPVVFDEKAASIDYFPELSGQVWGLAKNGDDIFCMHDKGLFIIRNNKVESIPGLRGALSYIPHETDNDKCWISTYDSFFLLQRIAGNWKVVHQIGEITNWPKNVVFESPGSIWVRRINEGLARLVVDSTTYEVKETRLFTSDDGLESLVNLYVHKVGNEVLFSSDSGVYKFDTSSKKIRKTPYFSDNQNPVSRQIKIIGKAGKIKYFLASNNFSAVRSHGAGVPDDTVSFMLPQSQVDLIRFYESVSVVDDSLVIIPNEYGFAMLNVNSVPEPHNDHLFIKNVFSTYPKDSLLFRNTFTDSVSVPVVSHRNNAIRIEYDVRWSSMDAGIKYRYRLSPDNFWSTPSSSTIKEYNNLREGDYVFDLEAIFPDGKSEFTSFAFVVLPPWYRSAFARVVYFILAVVFIFLIYRVIDRRLTRRRMHEIALKEEEMKVKEQKYQEEQQISQQQIIELKNENLTQELKHKSQEMANLMINLSRKNEVLIEIKEKLGKIIPELKDVKPKRMVLALSSEIDTNIQADDLFKRFEEQFDLIHNNFIAKIRQRHPNLTISEVKMCTYLKMNLSSKEMAPLLNLSVRGVETLRYRMRKKMGLDRDDNLMGYLNSLID
jgi:DNA-binding CsgD family transcriptional regulator